LAGEAQARGRGIGALRDELCRHQLVGEIASE
jgi:hypothetical protein